MRRRNREAGFTVIEILTVVVILAVLAAILLSTFLKARAQSSVAASKANLRNAAVALEAYFADFDSYPEELADLIPTYARAVPDDLCTRGPFAYDTSMGGSPITDYKLSVTYPLTNACRLVTAGLSYTPGGGVTDNP